MVSKIESNTVIQSKTKLRESIQFTNYCSDCIYNWCKKRQKVVFCTMKSKGFFECKACMLKLIIGKTAKN